MIQYFEAAWSILQLWLGSYLLLPLLFLIFYVLKKRTTGLFDIHKRSTIHQTDFHFGVVVTAYKEPEFITPIVDSLCRQLYKHITIYVVADRCDLRGLHYNDPRVVLLKPEQPLDSKVKSIAFAIRNFKQPHDVLTILDADNLVHPAFFKTVNTYFQKGFEAVQCDFKPKNKDTDFARMDAVGDTFNFFMDREARTEAGLSAAIWGSGISMKLALYQEISFDKVVGGFDKLLQAHLVARTKQIAFAKEAILYDEKITAGTALQQQRTRWINAHFKYMPLAAKAFLKGVRSANVNLMYYGYVNMRPPLFLLAGSALFFAVANIWINPLYSLCWIIALFLFITAFAGIVFLKNENKQGMQRTLLLLPAFAWRQALAMLKIKKAGKSFLPTTHNKVIFIQELTTTPAEPKTGAGMAS